MGDRTAAGGWLFKQEPDCYSYADLEIKKEGRLGDWDLVRLPRLSVLPVGPDQWKCLADMSRATP